MRPEGALLPLNSLWVGPRLGYLEQLCLSSAVAAGHQVRLFSYTPDALRSVPHGVELRDGAEVMAKDEFLLLVKPGFIAVASDLWRYRLLQQGWGCWIDMDLIVLRPFAFEGPFLFGWQDSGTVNNAVLAAPADSQFVADLVQLPQSNRCPPWFGPRRKLRYALRQLTARRIGVAEMPWGTYGPELVTYLVRTHGLEASAQPPEHFYPVPWRKASILYEPAAAAEALLTNRTHAIHMWHGRLGELASRPPPRGSFIAQMCERFGVDVSETR